MRRYLLVLLLLTSIIICSGCTSANKSLEIQEPEISTEEEETGEINGDLLQDGNIVRIVASTWVPFEYEINGQPKGVGMEITLEAFRRMGYETTVEFLPFKRAVAMLEDGQADMLTDVTINAERKTFGVFNNERILTSNTYFFVRHDSLIAYTGDFNDLKDYLIGINRGYNYSVEFDKAVSEGLLTAETADSTEQNMDKLYHGRIDLFIENELVMYHTAREKGYENQFKKLEPPFTTLGLFNLFSKKNEPEDLIEAFDAELLKMKADGTYQEIYNKYIQ